MGSIEGTNKIFFLMIRRPTRSTQGRSSTASDVYKRQLTLMLMGESTDENKLMLMMMMMQNGPNGMATIMDQMLPLLMLDDGETCLLYTSPSPRD